MSDIAYQRSTEARKGRIFKFRVICSQNCRVLVLDIRVLTSDGVRRTPLQQTVGVFVLTEEFRDEHIEDGGHHHYTEPRDVQLTLMKAACEI